MARAHAKPDARRPIDRSWLFRAFVAASLTALLFIVFPVRLWITRLSDVSINLLTGLRGVDVSARWSGNSTISKDGVTIVLLNYKRPDNIRRIVRQYLAMPSSLVHGIIVFNNAPRDDMSDLIGRDSRVSVLGASANVGIGNNRFFAASLARTQAVLSQDDDLLLSKGGIEYLLARWRAEPDRVHGTFCRGTKADHSKDGNAAAIGSRREGKDAKFGYSWSEFRFHPEQVLRQQERVQSLFEQGEKQALALGTGSSSGSGSAGGGGATPRDMEGTSGWTTEVMVDGTSWQAPRKPLRAVGMSDAVDASTSCPVLITRLVMFHRDRAHQYFPWVLRMADTIPTQKPFGHGEDLLLSLLSVRESGGKLNRVWEDVRFKEVTELPTLGVGVSDVNDDHIHFRSKYLRLACERLGLPCWDWVVEQ